MHDNGGLGSRSVPDISGNEGVCRYLCPIYRQRYRSHCCRFPGHGDPDRRIAVVDTASQVGVVVEDFTDTVIGSSELGRDWAAVVRWAIALDDGRLVFAAEGGLELA
jgi:hypothetical protein